MTLPKQLVVLIITLLMLVFLGTFLISVHNTRDYLEKQLESHAQDAATSLGLSISPHMGEPDLAIITSMTDAIFDRGFYRTISIEDIQGKPLVERVLPVRLDGVPEWFIDALPLHTPEGDAILMDGWIERGRVVVSSHPGYAYRQLWQNIGGTLRWFLISAAIALLAGVLLLRRVLRPLKAVEGQANAICNREFPILEPLPKTPDIRRIVEAMNRMSAKVRQMLDELESLAAGFRRQAYQDPVTGLANKRFFMDLLVNQIDSKEAFFQGVLCLVQLKNFKRYNDEHGYSAGDALLERTASELVKVADQWSGSQLAHLGGADFALLVEECRDDQVDQLAGQLTLALAGLYAAGGLETRMWDIWVWPVLTDDKVPLNCWRRPIWPCVSPSARGPTAGISAIPTPSSPSRFVVPANGVPLSDGRWSLAWSSCSISRLSLVGTGACCIKRY